MRTPTEILQTAERRIKDAAMDDSYALKRVALSAIADALLEGRRSGLEEAFNAAASYMEGAGEEQFRMADAIADCIHKLMGRRS